MVSGGTKSDCLGDSGYAIQRDLVSFPCLACSPEYQMTVSIVIPHLNCCAVLEELLQSIERQEITGGVHVDAFAGMTIGSGFG